MAQLAPGAEASVDLVVTEDMTAAAYARAAGEEFPRVLATPVMIGEMERAAAELMRPLLREGEISVGAKVEMSHFAPTPVGATLTTHARFVEQEGARFWFEVWSEDAGGTVGKGRHARAIIPRAGIEARAAERVG